MKSANWTKIKNEYINTDISQRKLAEKYDVSFNTLKERANREKWADAKKEQRNKITTKVQQKMAEKTAEREVDRLSGILDLSDDIQEAISEAIGQVSSYMTAPGLVENVGLIDASRLRKLAAALKDVKDIVCALEEKSKAQTGGGVVILPEVEQIER